MFTVKELQMFLRQSVKQYLERMKEAAKTG